MREIKFRAWDVCEKCMLNEKGDSVRFNNANSLFTVRQPFVRFDRGDIILMQYTGLKDKNGKEVYEGDVLGRESHKDFVFVVDFNCGKFSGVTKPGNRHRLDLNDAMNLEIYPYVEIIGNIYENEDLLK